MQIKSVFSNIWIWQTNILAFEIQPLTNADFEDKESIQIVI
jgi:hypothetical protein